MNALAIDCAVSKIAIAAKKETSLVKLVLDIGIKQSEKLLPAIDYVLGELGLLPKDLHYTAVTLGPGSFTGLRLGLSSLKALTLAYNIPLYGIPSLACYAWPYKKALSTVLSVIEAKEGEYFSQLFIRGEQLSEAEDKSLPDILKGIDPEAELFVCGPGAVHFCEQVTEDAPLYSVHCFSPEIDATESLFAIAEKLSADKVPPLQDYDGPLYIRKSEAEIVYEQNHPHKD